MKTKDTMDMIWKPTLCVICEEEEPNRILHIIFSKDDKRWSGWYHLCHKCGSLDNRVQLIAKKSVCSI